MSVPHPCPVAWWLIKTPTGAVLAPIGCRRRACAPCAAARAGRLRRRLEATTHDWSGFLTLTLDPARLLRAGIDPTDRAASMKSLLRGWRTYTQSVRRRFPDFAWARVVEPHHGADQRPHLHAIVAGGPKPGGFTFAHIRHIHPAPDAYWRTAAGKARARALHLYSARADGWRLKKSRRSTIGRTRCYTLTDRADAVRYVAKYMGKLDQQLPGCRRTFACSQNVPPLAKTGRAYQLEQMPGATDTPPKLTETNWPDAVQELRRAGWRVTNWTTGTDESLPLPPTLHDLLDDTQHQHDAAALDLARHD